MGRTSKLFDNSNRSKPFRRWSRSWRGKKRSFQSHRFCKVRKILKTLNFFLGGGGNHSFADFLFSREVCLDTYPRKEKRSSTVIYYKVTSNGAWQVERSHYTFMRWSNYRSVNIITGQPVVFLPDTAHFVTSFNRKQCLISFFTAHQLVRLKFFTVW